MTVSTKESLTSISASLSSLKLELLQLLPSFLNGLIVIVLGVVFAYFLKWSSVFIVRSVIRLLPNSIASTSFIRSNLSGLVIGIGRILFVVTIFFTLTTGLERMGFLIVSEWMQNLARYLPNLLGAIVIIFVGWRAKEMIADLIIKTLGKTDFSYSGALSKIFSWSIFMISLFVALEQVGVDMGLVLTILSILVGVAAGGIALTLALGARSVISDILYCYQLHQFFKIGQEIRFLNIHGKIKSIGPAFVSIETPDQNIAIPGGLFHKEIASVSRSNSKSGGAI